MAEVTHSVGPFGGWKNTLTISNGDTELLATLDVGPRVLVYRRRGGENVFNIYEDQLGGCGENRWLNRGGHRFWLAPESIELSYRPDNEAVRHHIDPSSGEVHLEVLQTPQNIRKTLSIKLEKLGSRVTATHHASNEGDSPITVSPWALSVMAAGGEEIIPQPTPGEHPRDLLPNRNIVLWPYTDLSDTRWNIGRKYWRLRQQSGGAPTKMGLAHREKWIAYLLNETLFLKTFDHQEKAEYPDGGCNFETFSNTRMLEVESLGPLVTLQPSESTVHRETWQLFPIEVELSVRDDDAVERLMAPILREAGLA